MPLPLYPLLRPALFALDPERAHGATLALLRAVPGARGQVPDGPLTTQLAGLRFPNPVGLAAGYDKNAQVPAPLFRLGFGFVEVGTVTPLPQAGNPRPRMFRLVEDRAVINRLGFNNGGATAARRRLESLRRAGPLPGPLGVNIGANKDSADRVRDYVDGLATFAGLADYITVNISSPNTPGLRALQDKGALEALLDGVLGQRAAPGMAVPVFLKVAPDLQPADVDDIARLALDRGLDGLIVSNTTVARPPLASPHRGEAGGLSGAPLRDPALQRLRDFRRATGGALPLIGVGGIASGADAWERIRAGASLVQLYSALVYGGPGLVRRIGRDLEELMRRDGFASIAQAVGSE